MADAYVGQIIMFAGAWAPMDWAFCFGQTMQIQAYHALFAILGTKYGGDGVQTFKLPDLRSRVPVGQGQGIGLSTYPIGATGGVETMTLTQVQMPSHTHAITAVNTPGTLSDPSNAFLAQTVDTSSTQPTAPSYVPTIVAGAVRLSPNTMSTAGASAPHANLQPYLVMNYIICVNGLTPARN
ncbi:MULTISPECIES: phage tail protein [Methylobacterium]|uniref:phage tail protein n=1 Tax=Methylobacterium TaxID=407 RepID=UPI0013EB5583|nr:tail fiber protein [Methylobacterium sp. DB0501]NGM36097.1 phage tail protein [Methylobacterium sp. DB0501]